MKRAVVDTNVGVVANGKAAGVSLQCQLSAVNALGELLKQGEVVVDVAGEMQAEYRRHFNPSGQPGVGDRFFYQVINNYVHGILRVSIPKKSNGSYVDFPSDPALKKFDPSDRKFAAAAKKSGAPVLNATDSDWLIHYEDLVRNGIRVEFVCSMNTTTWFA